MIDYKQIKNTPGAGSVSFTEVEVDFGTTPVRSKNFNIVDATVTAATKIMAMQSGSAPTGKNADDNEMDKIDFVCASKAGSFDVYATVIDGIMVAGKYKILYLKG